MYEIKRFKYQKELCNDWERQEMKISKVGVIVPVYNEEKTLGNVLNTLYWCKEVDKVVAIDDGSTDSTWRNLKLFKKIDLKNKIKLIRLKKNSGKGGVVKVGAKYLNKYLDAGLNYVLLVDADLVGLDGWHIQRMIDEVRNPGISMVIGLRDKGNKFLNMLMPYFPLNGGERAFEKSVFFNIIKNPLISGWGLESVMNDYCKKKTLMVKKIRLDGLDHIGLQTKKYGLGAFLKEIIDVLSTKVKLIKVRYD